MGYPLTQPEDYIGIIAISTNKYTRKDLESYIATYEQDILESLLGCDMAAELIADLDGDNLPVSPKFQEIFDAFCIDDSTDIWFVNQHAYLYNYNPLYCGYGCKVQWKSKGILELLRYQIFFYYTRDQQVNNTITGNVKGENNVSELVAPSMTSMKRNYNNSLNWYVAIQWRICKNENDYDYDSYNGIIKEQISII